MRFRKEKTDGSTPLGASDGRSALLAIEAMTSDALLVQGQIEATPLPKDAGTPSAAVRRLGRGREIAAAASGLAETGGRAGGLVDELGGAHETLRDASGKRLTFVLHLASRAERRHAGSRQEGHDDYYRVGDTGLVQMFAANVQELVDFAVILHRIAEDSLTPAICAHDFYMTGRSVQNLSLPERDLVSRYLGRPSDTIASPTPSQAVLLGAERRRIPLIIDTDHPAGIGGLQDETFFRAVAGQRAFFYDHVPAIADDAMKAFGELTGRFYHRTTPYRIDDADFVIVAQGAVIEALRPVVDYMRDKERTRAGLLSINMYRPFPSDEVTALLKGKKAATVVERTDQPMADEPPLTREIRAAMDRAMENGLAGKDEVPYAGCAVYRGKDRPRLHSGIYGVGGGVPSFAELVAVFRNMAGKKHSGRTTQRRFYLGSVFEPANRRFPHLQTLEQRLTKGYPDLDSLSLPPASDVIAQQPESKAVCLYSPSGQGGLFAGNLFAEAWCTISGQRTRTFADGGLDPILQPASLTMSFADGNLPTSKPEEADVVLVSASDLLQRATHSAKPGGALIIESGETPEATWAGLAQRMAERVKALDLAVYLIDGRVTGEAGQPGAADQLAVLALLGACAKVGLGADQSALETLADSLANRLAERAGNEHFPKERAVAAMRRGAGSVTKLDWKSLPEPAQRQGEAEPPWTIERVESPEGTVFDVTRFWHSVGYLYDVGESEQALTDPYMATGIVPARSSAFRDMTPIRLRLPEWLPENCTGCGSCWALCPESALPPGIHDLTTVITTACELCERDGHVMTQMRRVGEPLAKQAYRLVLDDGLDQYRTMGSLVEEAFRRLVEKTGIEGERLDALQGEYETLAEKIGEFPFARTETFFERPHKKQKGEGRLLSIALNPLSCTGCGICVAVCPEVALDWHSEAHGREVALGKNWQLQRQLGNLPMKEAERHVIPGELETQVNRLLNRSAYHSMVGGDGTAPGSNAKTALHLVAGAVESVMRPRFENHIERLSSLIEKTEATIQGKVAETVRINDFESFGKRLTRLERAELTAEELSRVASEGDGNELDPAQLARLTQLLTDIKKQRTSYVEGASGYGRSRMIMAIDAGTTSFWMGAYPYNPLAPPWAIHPADDAPVVSIGLYEGLTKQIADELKALRRLELELDGAYVAAEHDEYFERFGWQDFSDDEKALVPTVLLLVEDPSAIERSIATVIDSGFPIKVVGINRSGFRGDAIHGFVAGGAGVEALNRGDTFVLQASTGHPGHLIAGVVEGVAVNEPAVFHVFAPDTPTTGVAVDQTARHAEEAYKSRLFPLFTFAPGSSPALSLDGNPDAAQQWTSREQPVEEPSGSTSKIEGPLTPADWAARDIRFQGRFRFVGKGHRTGKLKPLAEFAALAEDARAGYEPYIDVVDDRKRHAIAIVPPMWVEVTEQAADLWRRLQRMTSEVTVLSNGQSPEPPSTPAKQETTVAPAAIDESLYHRLTERLLALAGYNDDPEFFKRSMREFVTRGSEEDSSRE